MDTPPSLKKGQRLTQEQVDPITAGLWKCIVEHARHGLDRSLGAQMVEVCRQIAQFHSCIADKGGGSRSGVWEIELCRQLIDAPALRPLRARDLSAEHGLRLHAVATAVALSMLSDQPTEASLRRASYFLIYLRAFRGWDEFESALRSVDPWTQLGRFALAETESSETAREASAAIEQRPNARGRVSAVRVHASATFVEIRDQSSEQQVAFVGRRRGGRTIQVGDYLELRVSADFTHGFAHIVDKVAMHIQCEAGPGPCRRIPLDAWQSAASEAHLLRRVADKFDELGFLQVRTPTLTDSFEGGSCRPYVTFENHRSRPMHLRVSSELTMLGYIAGGARRIYEIGSSFRNENPKGRASVEFPLFEAYASDASISELIDHVSRLVSELTGVEGFRHLTFDDAFVEICGFDSNDDRRCLLLAKELGVKTESSSRLVKQLFRSYVGPRLSGAVALSRIPTPSSPFIKGVGRDAKRVWLRVHGKGIAEVAENECSEAAVVRKLRTQLEEFPRAELRDYRHILNALRCGLPPVVGVGIGLERLHALTQRVEA